MSQACCVYARDKTQICAGASYNALVHSYVK